LVAVSVYDTNYSDIDSVVRSLGDAVLGRNSKAESLRRQRGRIFRTLMSGLERGRRLSATVRSMVLTLKRGVDDAKRFARWFQTLRKRIEHKFGFCLEYAGVLVDDGLGRVHAHILYKVRSLTNGVFLSGDAGYIPFEWLKSAWFDITKHSYGVFLQVLGNNPKRLARYFVAQYFSSQSGRMRLFYSWNWVFRGFCKVWHKCFAPLYSEALCATVRGGSDESITKAVNSAKAVVIRAWHKVLGMDMAVLCKKYSFLKPVVCGKQRLLDVGR
jgi:hypothetical protein